MLGLGEEQPAFGQHADAGAERRQRGDGDLHGLRQIEQQQQRTPASGSRNSSIADKPRSFSAWRRATW